MEYILKFIGVFVAMALVDVCWAYYFIKVGERKAAAAGTWAVLLFITGAFVTSNYVEDRSLVIAAALGSFFGTYYTVEHKRKSEISKTENENN